MNPYTPYGIPAFDRFLVWLSTTDLRLFLYPYETFHPLVRFAHVTAAAVLLGSIVLVDLRLMGFGRAIGATDLGRLALPWTIGGGVFAILSGLLLLLFDPIQVGVHTFFLPKMLLIVLGFANALAFHRFIKIAAVDRRHGFPAARIAGATSMALWLGVFLFAALNASERVASATAVLH